MRTRKLVTAVAVVALAAVIVSAVAVAGGFNWKAHVREDCKRLVVNARWAAKSPTDARLAKLQMNAKRCGIAIRGIPGN